MQSGPRKIVTPFRPIPLDVPEGMKPNEFFNSTENLNDLDAQQRPVAESGKPAAVSQGAGAQHRVRYLDHLQHFQVILNPLGRPVRRTQVPDNVRHVWNRMNQIIIELHAGGVSGPGSRTWCWPGEASLDATWPLTSPGVPSIRMLHNHFIVFPKDELRNAKLADHKNPNLTDGGQH